MKKPNSLKCKMGWHKWTAWTQKNVEGVIQTHPFSKKMISSSWIEQSRICTRCSLLQQKTI